VTAAGSGYTSVPALDLSAGAGTGATATAHVGVPLWAGSELVLAAFGSQFRITSGSVINLPAPVGTTITVAAQGNLTLRTLAARWFPLAMASGNGNVYPTSIILNNGPTHTAGAGAPGTTEPKGSTFQRTDGGVGTTLYVSQGGGTWNPVAGV